MINPVVAQQLAEIRRAELIADARKLRPVRRSRRRNAVPVRRLRRWWWRAVAVRRAAVP
ncbi:MAG TPA: hypothetical protein VK895_01050 [Jiangellaceae bacterium]|nr:hypothetical protein [Jiangellaceae bacterium]